MKTIRNTLFAILTVATGLAAFAANIDVRLNPSPTAPVIGTLESPSLAVSAEWPQGMEPVAGWRPIFFQNEFTVFVPNGDLGKDLSPKDGVPYLLTNAKDSPQLAISAPGDDAKLMSVDSRYARIRLSTTVLAYIKDSAPIQPTVTAPVIQPAAPEMASPTGSIPMTSADPSGQTIKTLVGILVKANTFERARFGVRYKLVNTENQNLAFVNTAGLAKFVLVADYVNTKIEVTGPIEAMEKGGKLIITARSLKKAL